MNRFFFILIAFSCSFCLSSDNILKEIIIYFVDGESTQEVGIFNVTLYNKQGCTVVEGVTDYVDGTKCSLQVYLTSKELDRVQEYFPFLYFKTKSEFEKHVRDVTSIEK